MQDVVSIHAPAWGATANDRYRDRKAAVSIHAPAWGATSCDRSTRHRKQVSIHAPAWGATARERKAKVSEICFNPRSRVGSDISLDCRPQPITGFNPRSRVGSDDFAHYPSNLAVKSFNPRSRVGSDVVRRWGSRGHKAVSIHAPAWGATRDEDHCHRCGAGFNPRSRVGSDSPTRRFSRHSAKFQSTLPRGERQFLYNLVFLI